MPAKKSHNVSLDTTLQKIIAIVTIFGFGYACAAVINGLARDNEKGQLESEVRELRGINDRLNAKINVDSTERRNWLLLNTTGFLINTSGEIVNPTLSVANASVIQCFQGTANGNCWKTEATAVPGDVIAVQLYCRNEGQITVNNVRLGFKFQNASPTRIDIAGGVMVGNQMARLGRAAVFLTEPGYLVLESDSAIWYKNPDPNFINRHVSAKSAPLVSDSAFYLGQIGPGLQHTIITWLRVHKGTP
jgi:hypothetical protein